MKAAYRSKYGAPEVLQISEVEKPVPDDNQILVRVFATTVNRTDCAILRGTPFLFRLIIGLLKPKTQITGTDFAGKIESVGKNVISFKEGERVWGFDDLGLQSHAQYMVISETKALSLIPDNVSYEQAAASAEGAHYAYNFINKVIINPGDRVLVNGATGAIGSAAVQLLKYFGAYVTAVCATENVDLAKKLGADLVIDFYNEDFTKSGHKFDFIFDAVGKSSFAKCKPLLKKDGVYISSELGSFCQNIFLALITPLLGGKKVIFPVPADSKRSQLILSKLLLQGSFRPLLDRHYSLDQIVEAYQYVETGKKLGNVIVRPTLFESGQQG